MYLKFLSDESKFCEITVISHSGTIDVAIDTAKLSAPPPVFEKLRVTGPTGSLRYWRVCLILIGVCPEADDHDRNCC